ncbi:hypothetical protein G9A89_015563 [Geosiphon pyriformis]|nr:hypothetical protein G9A89_015563 [Geosiphon pyriformis]
MKVLIIVDIWYSTAALGALETGGALKAGSVLKAVAASINEEKELTNLQVRIMAQWNFPGTSLLIGHCLSKSTENGVRIYFSLGKKM